jgi:hypothetical protein
MVGCFQLHPELLAEFRARRAALLNQQRCAPERAQFQFIRPSTAVFTEPPVRSASLSTRLHSISLLLLKLGLGLWTLASFHVTSDSSHLVSCKPVQDGASVQTADGTPCSITHKGSLCTSKFSVPDISFFPEWSMNLLSVGQITDMNYYVGFDPSFCYVQDRQSNRIIGTRHRRRGSTGTFGSLAKSVIA